MKVSLHGDDAAGKKTSDSRALRRRVAPGKNIHGSEGVTANFSTRSGGKSNGNGRPYRSGKKRIGRKNVSQFHHQRATPINNHTYNMYKKPSQRKQFTPRSNSSPAKVVHFCTPPPPS